MFKGKKLNEIFSGVLISKGVEKILLKLYLVGRVSVLGRKLESLVFLKLNVESILKEDGLIN